MGLSEDQRAMLRLLAQREGGYEDLAALMGLSVEEVRAKVKDALDQLEAEGKATPALPPESPTPKQPAEPTPPAAEPEPIVTEPPAPAPAAEPAEPEPVAPTPPAPPAGRPPRPKPSLPAGGGARAALAAGALVLIALVVVLLVSGGDSDNSGGASEGTTASEASATPTTTSSGREVTQAVLDPVDGSDAKGIATFGRVKNSLALQLEATGLEPTGKGESYTVWLYESPRKMLPLASTAIPESGKLAAQVEVPTEVLAYLANETFDQIDISLTTDATLKASLAKATREKKAPIYTGTDVLRGLITGPIIGAAR